MIKTMFAVLLAAAPACAAEFGLERSGPEAIIKEAAVPAAAAPGRAGGPLRARKK